MLAVFDEKILQLLYNLSDKFFLSGNQGYIAWLQECIKGAQSLGRQRRTALQYISQVLCEVYEKPVVVLIDEYDSPMHSAIEHNFATEVLFFYIPSFSR